MEALEAQQRRSTWFSRKQRLLLALTSPFRHFGPIDRVHLDRFPYPHYAYGVFFACMQAKMLGYAHTTVIEFGVAGGNGLVALESAAEEIGRALDIQVDVLGFDAGEGMPTSSDPRDMVYWFRPSAFKMDIPKLQSRLKRARLFIGLIEQTVGEATRDLKGPIGFIALDMDYYSATIQALKIFDEPTGTRQPRVMIYADDIFGFHDLNVVSNDVGEEGAFRDFNDAHSSLKIRSVRGLRFKRPIPAMWNEKIFAMHDFAHPQYNTPINPNTPEYLVKQSSLR